MAKSEKPHFQSMTKKALEEMSGREGKYAWRAKKELEDRQKRFSK